MVPGWDLVHFIKCLLGKSETLDLIASMVRNSSNNKTHTDILANVSNPATPEVGAGGSVFKVILLLSSLLCALRSCDLWTPVPSGENSSFSLDGTWLSHIVPCARVSSTSNESSWFLFNFLFRCFVVV